MEEAIRVLNQLQSEGFIADWAVGGGMATIFYTEPFLTLDVDVFAALPEPEAPILNLHPIYKRLAEMGYAPVNECVQIGKTPIQLLVPPSPLEEEALRMAATHSYGGTPLRVFRAEHLLSIYLSVGRPKDRARIQMLVEQAELDEELLASILTRHNLTEQWTTLKRELS
jgi:hypothetical protein